jgi:hypothetical protein
MTTHFGSYSNHCHDHEVSEPNPFPTRDSNWL